MRQRSKQWQKEVPTPKQEGAKPMSWTKEQQELPTPEHWQILDDNGMNEGDKATLKMIMMIKMMKIITNAPETFDHGAESGFCLYKHILIESRR